MGLPINFYLSLGALLVGAIGGIYFLVEWLRNSFFKPALFWGISLLCIFIFQIPTVLVNLGVKLTITEFNPFFLFAVSAAFLGVIAMYFGTISLTASVGKKLYIIYSAWLVVAVAYFSYFFFNSVKFTSYLPAVGLIVLFFLPVNLLAFIRAFKLIKNKSTSHSMAYQNGLVKIVWASLCSIGRNILFIWGFIVYPPSFWFLALQPQMLFWLQLAGSIFLIIGFLLMRKTILSYRPLPPAGIR